jgi:hypothetical protein
MSAVMFKEVLGDYKKIKNFGTYTLIKNGQNVNS